MSLIASSQKRLIVGTGETGLSVARFLSAQNLPFAFADTRENPPNLDFIKAHWSEVPLLIGAKLQEEYANFDEIIISPGVSRQTPGIKKAIEAGIQVIGDIELFTRHAKAPIAAITGTNGKTTVTNLLGEMAKASGVNVAVGGNIGTPALDLLHDDVELYILELSSFQLESTQKLNAEVATILNVTEDHMDRYDGMQPYLLAKQRICFGAKKMVVNKRDPLSLPPLPDNVSVTYFKDGAPDLKEFGVRHIEGTEYLSFGFENLIDTANLKLLGRHNIENALAALAMAEGLGFSRASSINALMNFSGVEHRCEFVAELEGVKYVNDSKATNAGATAAAIKGLGANKNLVLIAGGDAKGLNFTSLKPLINKNVKCLVYIGVDGDKVAQSAEPEIRYPATSMAEAVEIAKRESCSGDIILLSPACASFDMFKNYQDRGAQFKAAVKSLVDGGV